MMIPLPAITVACNYAKLNWRASRPQIVEENAGTSVFDAALDMSTARADPKAEAWQTQSQTVLASFQLAAVRP